MSLRIWVCAFGLGLLTQGAYSAPNTQLQDLFAVMMSKLEQPGFSAEDAAAADGAGAAAPAEAESKPPDAGGESATSKEGAQTPAGGGETPAAADSATEPAPPPTAAEPTAAEPTAALVSAGRSPGLPDGLAPIPLPEGVSPDNLPPGAVPIKVENGKITFAVVGKRPKSAAFSMEPNAGDFDDEIMKTTLSQKIKAIFHHFRIRIKRFFSNWWHSAKDVALTGSRALGDTVDTTKTYMSVVFAITANLLRRLADFVEHLPPPYMSSFTAFFLSLPMIPLNVGRAILEETIFG